MTLTQAVLLALLPVVCCFVRCALDGETISGVWLPASECLNLSFASWSPVLVFPWVLWGLVFGWNLWSPIVCNIVLTSVVFFLFVWLVKPTWKQLGVLALLFSLYTPFIRYMLSGMAEVICFCMLILFYGLAVNYLNKRKTCKLVLLFIVGALMTLMRPYLLLFLLLPAYLWIRRSGWRGALGSAAVIGTTLGALFCSPLFYGLDRCFF